ncbi:MAG: Flp pilus assembly protein CpaB [Bryobacteraceae bacterium]
MKKNMVPLLGIAFIVAIISTGVFYGLFAGKLRSSSDLPGHAIVVAARDLDRGTVIQPSDLRVSETQGVLSGSFSKPEDAEGATLLTALKANEPLLEERVTPRISDAVGAGGPVPTGMRAVTLHVVQSESLLNMLRPGSRVDLQAVTERNGGAELRTVLENVEVLATSSPEANGDRPAAVTVLLRAQDADMVALADSGSRIRVALRNPRDEQTTPRHSLALAALFSLNGNPSSGALESTDPTPAGWEHPIQLHVRVLSVSSAALEELRAKSAEIASDNSWRVAAFHSGAEARNFVERLEQKHELEVVSGERLMAGVGRPISYLAGAKPSDLRVAFSPEWLDSKKVSLQVKPRIGASNGPPTQLPDTSSFMIESRANDGAEPSIAAQLFPGHSWEHRRLVIFVSARAIQQTFAAEIAGAKRGR